MMCKQCAKSLPTGVDACPACHEPLTKEQKWATSYVPAKKFNRAGIWMLVAPFGVLIAVLFMWAISAAVLTSVVRAQEVMPAQRYTAEDLGIDVNQKVPSLNESTPTLYKSENSGLDLLDSSTSLGGLGIDTSTLQNEAAISLGESDIRSTAANIVNVVLGFIGILAILGIVFWPLAFVFLFKKELAQGVGYDERSGKGSESTVPEEVKGWNWGAAGLPMVWGAYYSVWMFLIGWIPFVNIVWWIVMGLKGSEWAWKKYKWISVEQFKYAQRKWMPWGIAFFVLSMLLMLLSWTSDPIGLGRMG